MQKNLLYFWMMFLLPFLVFSQETPLEKSGFTRITSYDELTGYVKTLDEQSDILSLDIIGSTLQNRPVYALHFSKKGVGKDRSKLKVLFFAQQHGNEQSGKEGMLLLAKKLILPEFSHLFNHIDLVLIPQVNPDGSEVNQRRNGRHIDLNRNHLIMTEPETQALHMLFDRYLFEVTMDVHEYSPYSESWEKSGYRKNSDVTLGACTNINISPTLRTFANEQVLPRILEKLKQSGFSSFLYLPGGPPEISYLRQSTFDINDGRQSLGIQNTLSFIQEGMNGKDMFLENIEHRAKGQMSGMLDMLELVYEQATVIKKMVRRERKSMLSGLSSGATSIQMIHRSDGTMLQLPVYSYDLAKDTILVTDNFRPVVESLKEVDDPVAYLIPQDDSNLVNWLKNTGIAYGRFPKKKGVKFETYYIEKIDSIDFEGDWVIDPALAKQLTGHVDQSKYWYVPVRQLKGKMIIQALEPKSMLGLATYPQFAYLVKSASDYPVLRVVKKGKE
ncbi:MAG TPA: M14 family zinc carboxypeptidase [Saprospiraceae bacterium]|nr:hypothetical protein [Saprospirales bacterium]HRQ28544.1 M14 family zinc carboxypeptidase [Saprospiraceae bacterium]